MSCICEGGFHPACPIHKEVKLELNREQLDVLIDVLCNCSMQSTQHKEDYVNFLYKRAKRLRKKLE